MSTTIDNLQIQIQTSSTNAAAGIRDLSAALTELKKSGTLTTVVKNLKGLSEALNFFSSVSNAVSKISSLSTALTNLKSVGSLTTLVNSIKALPTALNNLSQIGDINGVAAKVKSIAKALAPLSNIKSSGFTSAVNSLKKISEVTKALDESTISEFTNKVKKLADALGPLSEKLTTVKSGLSGFNKAANESGKEAKKLGLNISSINLDSFTNLLKKLINGLDQIARKIKEITAQAVQWEGISARFGRGFGEQAEETYAWIKRLNEEMGINIQSFMQQSSIYATMLKGFGVANEDASKMALGYMELTYDIWAGYNDIYQTFEDAATAIRSAIAGEVEPIRKAGFTIVEATLEVTAANHGITKSLESMTEAEKSYLRYLTIIDQAYSQNLVGTYAAELDTAEGLLRTLSQQTKSLSQAFGSLFLPLMVKALPYVQAFISLLTELVHIVAGIFNVKIQEVDWSGYNEGADSIGDITDSANKAEEEVKKLKNAVLGMDELNVIGDSSASGVDAGLSAEFANLDINSLWDSTIFENINKQVKEITASMREWLGITKDEYTWTELMDTRLGSILKTIGAIATTIGTIQVGVGLMQFVDSVKKSGAIAGFAKTFAQLGVAIKNAGGFWAVLKTVLQKVGSKLGWIGLIVLAVVSAIEFLVKYWKEFTQAVKDFWGENIAPKLEKIKEQFEGIKTALAPLLEALQPLFDFLKKAFEFIGGLVVSTSVGATMGLIMSFLEWIEGIVQGLRGFFQFVKGIFDLIKALFTGSYPEEIKAAMAEMQAGIKNVGEGIYKTIIGPIVEWFKGVIDWFKTLGSALEGTPIVEGFKDLASRIGGLFQNLWVNIKEGFEGMWQSLTNGARNAWEKLKSWWNKNVKLSIPSLDFKVTYSTEGLNAIQKGIVKVLNLPGWPKLSFAANGGMFEQGSMIWAGERGAEIVANARGGKTGVMNVQQMYQAVYDATYSAMVATRQSQQQGGGAYNLYIDGKQVATSVEKTQKNRGATIFGTEVYSF